MINPGITLSKLQTRGRNCQNIEVGFSPGLNIIYGASDTGKSYILECLIYMLGGSEPPKDIPERNGYEALYLEGESNSKTFTLKRSLDGGEFLLFRKPLIEIGDAESGGETLSHVNDFLLPLLEVSDVRLLKNQNGETRNFSFRDIRLLTMVEETRILDTRSPILTGQNTDRTVEQSVFKYLMTGRDDAEFIGKASPKKTKERVNHQLVIYDKLIEDAKKQIADMSYENIILEESITSDDLALQIESITDNVSIVGQEVDAALAKRDDVYAKRKALESRLEEIGALLGRFKILRKQYQSDLERLGFISEGQHLFAQLKPIACPYCGYKLRDHKSSKGCDETLSETDLALACKAELQKVRTLLADLESTVVRLQFEQKGLNTQLLPLQENLFTIQTTIENILRPRIKSGKFTLHELMKQKDFVTRRESLVVRLHEYETARKKLQSLAANQPKTKEENERIGKSYLENFCQRVAALLNSWAFPYEGNVYFDSKTMDLVIGGKARGSFGKGLRAVSHAAFVISLMNYCVETKHTHPGVIVLDSPLTAHRGKHKDKAASTEDEISKEIEEKFFSTLALLENRQVIILENVSPPEGIKSKARWEYFSGSLDTGRYGFYPVLKANSLA